MVTRMALSNFLYRGPVNSSATLLVEGKELDVIFHRGHAVALPADHEYVRVLIQLGHLVAQPAAVELSLSDATQIEVIK